MQLKYRINPSPKKQTNKHEKNKTKQNKKKNKIRKTIKEQQSKK